MESVQVFDTRTEEADRIETQENRIRRAALKYVTLESGVGRVFVFGRLDILGVQQIELNFTVMTAAQRKSVIVDLSGVELMSSIGLGMLIANANALYACGKTMVVLNPQHRVEKIIRIAGVDQILPIAYYLDDALEMMQECEAEKAS